MPVFRPLLVLALALCASTALRAATMTFVPASGDFNVPANWMPATVPGPGDTASFGGGQTVTVSDTRSVAALTMSGGNLVVTSPGAITIGTLDVNANTFPNSITGTGNITLTGSFTHDLSFTFGGTGQFIVASGAVFTETISATLARPIVVQSGGTFNFSTGGTANLTLNGVPFTLQESAVLNLSTNNTTITGTNGATLVNGGTIHKTSLSGNNTLAIPVSNSGQITVDSGILIASGAYTDAGGTIFVDGGTFQIPTLNLTSGTIFGFGTISGDVNQSGGSILPGGTSPGVLDITGNYVSTGGSITFRLSGTAVSEDVSRLDVGVNATVGGTLIVALLNGYQPLPTDTYEVIAAMSLGGTFTGINAGGSLLGPKYQPSSLVLQRVTTSLAVTSVEATPNPARAGGDVTFNAVVDNPANAPLTFSWNFGDGSSASGNPVIHAYSPTIDTTYDAQVTVFDGQQNALGTFQISVLVPNVLGSGQNISQGKMVENPLSGLQLTITNSDAGLIELVVTENTPNAQTRALGTIETEFTSDDGAFPTRASATVVQKFSKSGIVVAKSTNKDPSTGATRARVRKTIPVSSREVEMANSSITAPQNRALLTASFKGKFIFASVKPDQVTYSGSFEMPAGINLSENQTLVFAMGNVIDSVTIDKRGKALTPSTQGTVKKMKVKYPRVDRKNPVTQAGQIAKITATYFTADLDLKGFDTEGITAAIRADEEGLKAVERSIQLAMTLSGITYEAAVPVEFKRTPKLDAGTFTGRSFK